MDAAAAYLTARAQQGRQQSQNTMCLVHMRCMAAPQWRFSSQTTPSRHLTSSSGHEHAQHAS